MGLIGNTLSAITGISKGDITQKMMQLVGFDRRSAAYMGAMTDMKSGNLVGFHQNLQEAMTGFETGGTRNAIAHAMVGGMMPGAHFVGMPGMYAGAMYGAPAMMAAQATGGVMTGLGALGGFAVGGPIGAVVGGIAGNIAGRFMGAVAMNRMMFNPMFAGSMGAMAGGTMMLGAGMGAYGALPFAASGFNPMLPGLMPGAYGGMIGNPMMGGVLGGMQRYMHGATGMIQGMGYAGSASYMGDMPTVGETRMRMNARPDGELIKLPMPATFEDLIAAFMMDVMKDMQDEVKDKLAEYEKMKGTSQSKGGDQPAGNTAGGFLGGMFGGGGLLRGLGKAVGTIGGGLLGGVLGIAGGPIGIGLGAFAGQWLGRKLGGGVGSVAGSVLGLPFRMLGMGGAPGMGGQAGQPLGGARDNPAGTGVAGDEDSRQLLFEKIKNLMQKMQQMIQSLSNVLNTMHQGAMNAIRNIRA